VEDVLQMFVSEKYEEIENVNPTYTEYVLVNIDEQYCKKSSR